MLTEDLEQVGLTKSEAKIYLALLEQGSNMAGKLSKITLINRRTTYDTIERLLEKGYIGFTISANRKVFSAANPDIILYKIDETKTQAKELVPKLKNLFASQKEPEESLVYRGRKGIRAILKDLINSKEYVGFGSNENFPGIMGHDFEAFQREKKERKVKSRTLMSSAMRNKSILKSGYTGYKFLPEKFSMPTSTFVYRNKVAIIIWSEIPTAMVMENKSVAKSFLQYFNALWKIAKP